MNWKSQILAELRTLEEHPSGLDALRDDLKATRSRLVGAELGDVKALTYRVAQVEKILARAEKKQVRAEKKQARAEKAAERARVAIERKREAERARIERLRSLDPYNVLEGTAEERRVDLVLSAFEHGQGKVYARWMGARASVVLEAARTYARVIAHQVGRVYLRDGAGPLEEIYG